VAGTPLYIKFFGDVDRDHVTRLMDLVDDRLAQGQNRFVLLLSTVGGSVFHGLSAYNFLKGIDAELETHNFGSVDSIGTVLYCAGRRRYAVPQSRFVLHMPFFEFDDESLGERQLAERLGKLQVDARNMAAVLSQETGRPFDDVLRGLRHRTVLDATGARTYGLVHEVRSQLVPPGAELVSVSRAPSGPSAEMLAFLEQLARQAHHGHREEELVVHADSGTDARTSAQEPEQP